MTYEEFLEALRGNDTIIFRCTGVGEKEYNTIFLVDIAKAVRKEMPKQPETLRCNEDIRIGRGVWKAGTPVMKCGSCGEWIVPHWKYCSECGQRIGGSQ